MRVWAAHVAVNPREAPWSTFLIQRTPDSRLLEELPKSPGPIASTVITHDREGQHIDGESLAGF